MEIFPKNKFGYLVLYETEEERSIYVKANKVTSILPVVDETFIKENGARSTVTTYDNMFYVVDSIDEIFEQLENIHPSLR